MSSQTEFRPCIKVCKNEGNDYANRRFYRRILAKHCIDAGSQVLGIDIVEPQDGRATDEFELCDVRDAARLTQLDIEVPAAAHLSFGRAEPPGRFVKAAAGNDRHECSGHRQLV